MTQKEHKLRHKELHRHLKELVADYINCTGNSPSQTSLIHFMAWSAAQAVNPMEVK